MRITDAMEANPEAPEEYVYTELVARINDIKEQMDYSYHGEK